MIVYRVKNWDDNFENDRSRRVDNCSFVCVPNKQHGIGLAYILAEPDGLAIYGVWNLILGLCSQQKNPRKGWLTSDGKKTGTPLLAHDLALKFRREESEIQRALDFISCASVGWMEALNTIDLSGVSDDSPSVHHTLTTSSPPTHLEGRKEGMERRKEVDLLPIPENIKRPQFLTIWTEWKQYRIEIKHPLTPIAAKKQLSMLSGIGLERAIVALNHTMQNQWQGIYEPRRPVGQPIRKIAP